MTPTEWEIITLGLLEKLRGHFYFNTVGGPTAAANVREFVEFAKKLWKEEDNAKQ